MKTLVDRPILEETDIVISQLLKAQAVDPENSLYYSLEGTIRLRAGDKPTAAEAFKKAIKRSIDCDPAIHQLILLGARREEKFAALNFIRDEINRQKGDGTGIRAYGQHLLKLLGAHEFELAIKSLIDQFPDLWAVWPILTDYYLENNQTRIAVDHVKEAVEQFPDNALAHYELARVNRIINQREIAITALEKALELDPNFVKAAKDLSEIKGSLWYDDIDDQSDIITGNIKIDPNNPESFSLAADQFWIKDDIDKATENLKNAILQDPTNDWAWQRLLRWLDSKNRIEEVEEFIKEFIGKEPGQAIHQANLSRYYLFCDDIKKAKEAIDKAREIDPDFIIAVDFDIQIQIKMGSLDVASKLYRKYSKGYRNRRRLKYCRAIVAKERGKAQKALLLLEEHLKEYLYNLEAWEMFADLARTLKENQRYENALRRMAELEPKNAKHFGLIGQVYLEKGHRDQGKQEFARAYRLDPKYIFSSTWYFRLCLEDDEIESCNQILNQLKAVDPENLEVIASINLLKEANARKAFENIVFKPDAPLSDIKEALTELKNYLNDNTILILVEELFNNPDASPMIGRIWVEINHTDDRIKYSRKHIGRLNKNRPAQAQAHIRLLEILTEHNDLDGFINHMRRHKGTLRRDPYTWSAVGKSYFKLEDFKACIDWMSDYESKENLETDMLETLILSCALLDNINDIQEVVDFANSIDPNRENQFILLIEALLLKTTNESFDIIESKIDNLNCIDFSNSHKLLHFIAEKRLLSLKCLTKSGNEEDIDKQQILLEISDYIKKNKDDYNLDQNKFLIRHVINTIYSDCGKSIQFKLLKMRGIY